MDLGLCRLEPMDHQIVGVRALLENDLFALFDEQGVGKTKQVVDAAGFLFLDNVIDQVLVIAPGSVRSVWVDPELGEIAKHAFVPVSVAEYSSRGLRGWLSDNVTIDAGSGRPDDGLEWIVTNYEFVRRANRLAELVRMIKGRRTLLVLDEATAVKNPRALQTRAVRQIRKYTQRIVLLTGTPVANSPLDLFSLFDVAHRGFWGYTSFFKFKITYANLGGFQGKQIIGYKNLTQLQKILAPYVLRRTKEDCLDLPPKVHTFLEVPLSPATWQIYKSMRDDMVAWLEDGSIATAPQAGVRGMRLAQICSGYLGGIEDGVGTRTDEIGRDKLDAALEWAYSLARPRAAIIWCRFRPELDRMREELLDKADEVVTVRGGQKPAERDDAKRALGPDSPPCDTIMIANPQAGGVGLKLQRADRVLYVSRDHSLTNRLQSEDRCHRRGTDHTVIYTDLIATGPAGQKTIDHAIVRALRKKEDVATWTTDQWRAALRED